MRAVALMGTAALMRAVALIGTSAFIVAAVLMGTALSFIHTNVSISKDSSDLYGWHCAQYGQGNCPIPYITGIHVINTIFRWVSPRRLLLAGFSVIGQRSMWGANLPLK